MGKELTSEIVDERFGFQGSATVPIFTVLLPYNLGYFAFHF